MYNRKDGALETKEFVAGENKEGALKEAEQWVAKNS